MRIRTVMVIGTIGLGFTMGGSGLIVGSAQQRALPIQIHSGSGWGMPAVDGSDVIFLTGDHRLVSVDQHSGRVRWVSHLNSGAGGTTAGSTVLVDGGVVVAGDFDLFAFDRVTGERRWRFSPVVGHGLGIYLGAIAGGVVFAGSPSGRIYAIDATDGRLRWQTESLGATVTAFAPSVVAGGVVAGYTDFAASPRAGGVALFDAADGELKWLTRFSASVLASADRPVAFGGGPIAVNGLVIAASSDGAIHALDRQSGGVRWTVAPEGPSDGEDYRPMTLSGRTLVVGSLSGTVTAIDVDSRHERWRRALVEEGSVAFRIESDRQSVYVPYASGKVVVLDVAMGQERWRAGSRDIKFAWPPALTNDRIFLTSEDGLYVLSNSIR